MSFTPFVGVNHHGQSTLLGCGLLSNEDTDTFVWVFKIWLECMHGQAPHRIITNQDRAMQNAIQIVFPNTKHRWCLWHVLKKLLEKFGYLVHKGNIFSTIHRLVYDSQTGTEFEKGWGLMIDEYELHDNDWLAGLCNNRACWVPYFLKTTFWAGMSTTHQSESMNAFFDVYVHSKTSLKQFVEQYKRALRNKVEKEYQADFKSYSQMLVYSMSRFREVQDEFTRKVYCDLLAASEGSSGTTYEILEDVLIEHIWKKKKWFVSFRRDSSKIVCSCHLFEFRGIIRRHAIVVLIRNNVTSMPERYVLRMWRKDVSRAHTRVAVNYAGLVTTPAQLRYDDMCRAFSQLADLTTDDEGRSRIIMDWIKCQYKELTLTKSSNGTNVMSQPAVHLPSQNIDSQKFACETMRDPILVKRKGAPKIFQTKGSLESRSKKKREIQLQARGKHRGTYLLTSRRLHPKFNGCLHFIYIIAAYKVMECPTTIQIYQNKVAAACEKVKRTPLTSHIEMGKFNMNDLVVPFAGMETSYAVAEGISTKLSEGLRDHFDRIIMAGP
ncbi:protein FAR-RED IMPAIRED RESPONSE 1-like [Olea europaea var. sylvestris]|uniref:protein FAR-RED IMPAIRED RESPONSE 1-like n=1 Tax=Olea europaea var. sylvestris TaxID=158386 RepID=UPI000C1D72B8|nr:protein FAR-RED IMPAIRED RESPONSE 1-like [Olea europaea var. sylvestris]